MPIELAPRFELFHQNFVLGRNELAERDANHLSKHRLHFRHAVDLHSEMGRNQLYPEKAEGNY